MTFRVYRDRQGYWRWRLESANNRIIADSGEGYFNRRDCVRGRDTTPPGRAWTLASTMSCLMRAVIFRLDFRFLGRREAADTQCMRLRIPCTVASPWMRPRIFATARLCASVAIR